MVSVVSAKFEISLSYNRTHTHTQPVEMHSSWRLVMSLSLLPFISSGPAHRISDTEALVLFSHIISHLARQSHSNALPLRSLLKKTVSQRGF